MAFHGSGNNARRWNLPSSGARRSHLSPTTNDKLKHRLFTKHRSSPQAHYRPLIPTNDNSALLKPKTEPPPFLFEQQQRRPPPTVPQVVDSNIFEYVDNNINESMMHDSNEISLHDMIIHTAVKSL